MIKVSSSRSFLTRAALTILSYTFSVCACSSQNLNDGQAGAAGVDVGGNSAVAGTSGGGSSGSLGASGFAGAVGGANAAGAGGAMAGSAGASGGSANAGNGGETGGATLPTDCATSCAAQTALSCTNGPDCQTSCLAPGNTTNPNVTCQPEYAAMIHCDAPLTASQWMCSQDAAPVPVAGPCTSTVCAYACCVGALVADQDLWSRCMPMCTQ